jgi:hypothetical protein
MVYSKLIDAPRGDAMVLGLGSEIAYRSVRVTVYLLYVDGREVWWRFNSGIGYERFFFNLCGSIAKKR